MKPVSKNLIIIVIFIVTVLGLFINKLTTPRTLSNDELLVNGLFLFDQPKDISDFNFTLLIKPLSPNQISSVIGL